MSSRLVCEKPVVSAWQVEEHLGWAARRRWVLLRGLEQRGVLSETGRGERGQRRYVGRKMMAAVTAEGRRLEG